MFGLGLRPEHITEPPAWLRLLTFGAACMTAGILIGGAIVLSVALGKQAPAAACPTVAPFHYAPSAPSRWREHNGEYDA